MERLIPYAQKTWSYEAPSSKRIVTRRKIPWIIPVGFYWIFVLIALTNDEGFLLKARIEPFQFCEGAWDVFRQTSWHGMRYQEMVSSLDFPSNYKPWIQDYMIYDLYKKLDGWRLFLFECFALHVLEDGWM